MCAGSSAGADSCEVPQGGDRVGLGSGGVRMDPWSVLGLTRGATEYEVKKAWKKAALRHHPDRGGSVRSFYQAKAAYDFLCGDESGDLFYGDDESRVSDAMMLSGPVVQNPFVFRHDPSNPVYNQEYMNQMYGWLGHYGRDGLLRSGLQKRRRRKRCRS